MEKPTSDDIQKIMKENTINIPAGILYTFLQFTEIGSQRGAFKANELSMIGNIYDSGTQILNKLIEEKWKQIQSTPIQNTPIQNTPIQSTPIQNTPIQSTPIQSTPIQNTPIQSKQNLKSKSRKSNLKR